MQRPYREDLAHVHDAGFTALAERAAGVLLAALEEAGLERGTVVDLGCGGGTLLRAVRDAGYGAVGVDLSPDLLAIARERVPDAELRLASFLDVELPCCVAVTAIGEVLGYAFDERNAADALDGVLRRVHAALVDGGVFLFDLAGPGRAPVGPPVERRVEGPDWTVVARAWTDAASGRLVRECTTERRVEGRTRREIEVHRLVLHEPARVLERLAAAGFEARRLPGYGEAPLPEGWSAFRARRRTGAGP